MEDKNNSRSGTCNSASSFFQKHTDFLKGCAALFGGAYMVFLKYKVILDFGLLVGGAVLILYGISAMGVANIRGWCHNFLGSSNNR